MNDADPAFLRRKLAELRVEHRELDTRIIEMQAEGFPNELEVRRLKKRKLQLRDYMALVESRLIPDMGA